MKLIKSVLVILWLKLLLDFPAYTYASETLYYIHQDHLNSTNLVTDEQGNVVNKQVYYPYGQTRNQQPAASSQQLEKQYTGQISDQEETGLYYYKARYYNPNIAKFTSADFIEGLNRYSYVFGNPLIMTDPSGNQAHKYAPGSSFYLHNKDDDLEAHFYPPLPWDLPWYSYSATGMDPMLAFLYKYPYFDLQRYVALMTAAGYDFSAYCMDTILGDYSFTQNFVQYELGLIDDPFGGNFTDLISGPDLVLTGAAIAGNSWSMGAGSVIKELWGKIKAKFSKPQTPLTPPQNPAQFPPPGANPNAPRARDRLRYWAWEHGIRENYQGSNPNVLGISSPNSFLYTIYGEGGFNTGIIRHEISHAIGEGGQILAFTYSKQWYANECWACSYTLKWLTASGYPPNHPYVINELNYWRQNYQGYLNTNK